MKRDYKKLFVQFIKFSIVGVLAFCIDYGLFLLLTYVFGMHYLFASATSFIVATIFNFLVSMRYVFNGRENQTRTQQFVIFFALSLIGLGLNQLILWFCVDCLAWLAWFGKLVATAIVMVFNFVSRKYCLEDHQKR
jgi:putative flippase GtrA